MRCSLKFEEFSKSLRAQFAEVELLDATLDGLYEVCVQAAVEKAVINKAREIMPPRAWRKSEQQLRKVIQALQNGPAVKFEEYLRKRLSDDQKSRTRSSAAELSKDLFGLKRICSWWEGLASSDRWKKYYAGYIWTLNKQLSDEYKTEDKRADIIAAAMAWMKVESQVSKDAILRSLTRERKKPRRFVFKEPDLTVFKR